MYLIAILATTLGIQNTAVRKLGVPDLTTTVLTLTITGIGADSRFVGGSGSKAGRRLLSVASMFLGAFIGTLLILYASIGYPLLVVSAITVVVASLARVFSRGNPAWVSPKYCSNIQEIITLHGSFILKGLFEFIDSRDEGDSITGISVVKLRRTNSSTTEISTLLFSHR